MPKITILRAFSHVVPGDIHPTRFEPGDADVSERTAQVAIEEGWAIPFPGGDQLSGPPSPASGPTPSSSSSPAAPASTPTRSASRSGRGRREPSAS